MWQRSPGDQTSTRRAHRAAHRVYFAITNACNRACPWCSVYSRPGLSTHLPLERFRALLPSEGRFEAQLEGGEPTLHGDLEDMIEAARATGRCDRVVLCTNGVRLPHEEAALSAWIARLGTPTTIKLSVNHHLFETDPHHLARAEAAARAVERQRATGRDVALVLNLRRRKSGDRDEWLRARVEAAGLLAWTNDFFLQRYGLASGDEALDAPFLAGLRFTLVNPDGSAHGTDLIARSEAMRSAADERHLRSRRRSRASASIPRCARRSKRTSRSGKPRRALVFARSTSAGGASACTTTRTYRSTPRRSATPAAPSASRSCGPHRAARSWRSRARRAR